MHRRAFLVGLAGAGAGGLAGCLAIGGQGPTPDEPTPTPTPSPDPSDDTEPESPTPSRDPADDDEPETPTSPGTLVDEASITTTEASCADGAGDGAGADWRVEDDTVMITGRFVAPNPCHEAVLASVDVVDGRIEVAVESRSDREAGTTCVQCVGSVSYRAELTVTDGDRVEEVDVSHRTPD
ncbi:MAG: hypothetical protein ACLFMX_01270 [Halobacteriales archaeon]